MRKHIPKYVRVGYTTSDNGSFSNSFHLRLEGDITQDAKSCEISDLLRKWNEVSAVFPQAKKKQTFDQARDFLLQTKGRGVLWLVVGG